MQQNSLEIQTDKKIKTKSHYFLVCSIRSDLCFRELQTFATALAAPCPWVFRCARQWQLTGTNSFAPGLPGMWTQKGSVSWKRNLPRKERNSHRKASRSPPPKSWAALFVRCVTHARAAVCTPPQGRGMPRCSELTCSQVHVEAFQATQLLTALQLLFHAVLLYITLLSLPGGTAVLQYNHLAKCKTDFFTSQIPTDCCHCSHNYKTCSVLDFPGFVYIQEILISSLLFSLLPNLLLLASLSCSPVLSVEGSHPQLPAQGITTIRVKMPKPAH